jgi:hypothetical protein
MANCGLLLNDGTSFVLLNDSSFLLLNDNSCATEPDGTAPVVTIPPGGGGNYLEWWERERARILEERKARKKKKISKKKRTLLEELDDILLELRARIREDDAPTEVKAEVRRIQTFSDEALNAAVTAEQVRLYVSLAEAIAREMDDEETIILALH